MMFASSNRLLKLSSGLLAARLTAAAVTLLTQVLLTRIVSPDALGQYFFITSAVTVLAVFVAGGYPNIANRVLASLRRAPRAKSAPAFVKSISARVICRALVAIGAGFLVLIWLIESGSQAYFVGLLAIPVLALSLFWGAVLNGERLFLSAALPDLLLRPALFLAAIIAIHAFDVALTPTLLTTVFLALIVSAAAIQFSALQTRFSNFCASSGAAKRQKKIWKLLALPLISLSLFLNFFADVAIFYSGLFLTAGALAPLAIAIKLAFLVGFFVQAIHQIVLPDFSDAARRADFSTIQDRLFRVNGVAAAFTGTALCLVYLYGHDLLAIFGPEYAAANVLLITAVASQLARALCGPAAQLLVIMGHQRMAAMISISAFMLFAAAGTVMMPAYGAVGAALSLALAYVYWNVANAFVLARVSAVRSYFNPFAIFSQSHALQNAWTGSLSK